MIDGQFFVWLVQVRKFVVLAGSLYQHFLHVPSLIGADPQGEKLAECFDQAKTQNTWIV